MEIKLERNSIYNLMKDLVKVPSVSPGPEEVEVANLIHDKLAQLPYFQANKEDLTFIPYPDDPLKRKAVFAIVRAKPETKRTIILTGHIDVVDTSEARSLAELAFHPEEYTKRIGELELPKEAKEDLESGKYLFGRGVMDMKTGIAMQMALLADYSRDLESMPANIAFLAVGDEENNSAGMISAISFLANLQEEGLDFIAAVNSEGIIPKYPGDTNRYIDIGTIGKIMPMFYCVGRESHVGQYYAGLNANLLSSAVSMLLEANADWAESWRGEVYPPPASLKQQDHREIYSVTLPARAAIYFNHLTVTSTPAEIMDRMKDIAQRAFEMTLEHMQTSAEKFTKMSNTPVPIPWEIKIRTWEELFAEVEKTFSGNLQEHVDKFIANLAPAMDERDKSLAIVGELIRLYPDKNPMILVGFLPPYYPHRTNKREAERELELLTIVEEIIEQARQEFSEPLAISEHFTSICDLSYVGFQGERDELLPLAYNTPGWGNIYDIPLDDLLKLDIPSVNLGPAGKDAHKFIERLELDYSLDVVPVLFKSLVEKLGNRIK